MFSLIAINILGVFLLLFFLWKRLKEDYHYEKTFSLAAYIFAGLLVFTLISKYFLPQYWFWAGLFGLLTGFIIGVLRHKMRIYESFEGVLVGTLLWLSLVFIRDSIINSSLFSFLAFWLCLLCVFMFYFLDSHYKNFVWYKSGRVGFAGLLTVGMFFIARSLVALFGIPMISFVGRIEGILSGSLSLISFILLFKLSSKK